MRTLLALALCSAVAVAAPVPKAVKKLDDPARLVGKWTVVSDDGKLGDQRFMQTMTFHPEGGMRLDYNSTHKPVEWELTLDDTATPKTVRWYCPITKTSWNCVYELDGDTLRVGLLTSKADPPAKLERGPGVHLLELTRALTK